MLFLPARFRKHSNVLDDRATPSVEGRPRMAATFKFLFLLFRYKIILQIPNKVPKQ
jgi:hypothetical protein